MFMGIEQNTIGYVLSFIGVFVSKFGLWPAILQVRRSGRIIEENQV